MVSVDRAIFFVFVSAFAAMAVLSDVPVAHAQTAHDVAAGIAVTVETQGEGGSGDDAQRAPQRRDFEQPSEDGTDEGRENGDGGSGPDFVQPPGCTFREGPLELLV